MSSEGSSFCSDPPSPGVGGGQHSAVMLGSAHEICRYMHVVFELSGLGEDSSVSHFPVTDRYS